MNKRSGEDIDLRHLSSLNFVDYVKLKRDLDANGENANELVFQHDHDAVEYLEAYSVVHQILHDMEKLNSFTNNYLIDCIGLLLSLLVDKKVLTGDELETLAGQMMSLYDLSIKESKEKE